MDLQTIATRTRLPIRKIRYVLDHRLLPGLQVPGDATRLGRARSVTELEALAIVCAAVLLEAGVRRETVIDFMAALSGLEWEEGRTEERPQNVLLKANNAAIRPAIAMLGDGINIRVHLGARDTGWLQPGTYAPLAKVYSPRVAIQVDLARLRDDLRRW